MKKVKVMHVLNCMDIGGIENFIMNLYRNIDREKINFMFLLFSKEESFYDKEIEKYGGKIFHIGFEKNLTRQFKNIYKVLKNEKPDVLHVHTLFYSWFVLLIGKILRIKLRIVHSHTKNDNKKSSLVRKIYRNFASFIIKITANKFLACSKESAMYLYGKKTTKKSIILKNGIDTKRYLDVDNNEVSTIVKKYNLKSEEYIILMIARLAKEKNHDYAILIANKLRENKIPYKLLFLGDGPLKDILDKKIKENNLEQNVFLIREC